MKVLWISLRIFEEKEEVQTAVWLKSLAVKLTANSNIELANISFKNGIYDITVCNYKNIKQWALPFDKINKKGYPSNLTQKRFEKVIDVFKPDIIQVWGSENPLKLLPFDEKYQGIKVLTIQGVLASIAPVMLQGLSVSEILFTIGIREIVKRENLLTLKKSFERDGLLENEMIKKSNFIITQSDWTDSQLIHINPKASFFRTQRVLRDNFINAKKWDKFEHKKQIIYSSAIGYSLKGLHILIKALFLIKEIYPNIELRLAGAIGRIDFLGEGYLRLIIRMIKKYKLESNIIWLGAIPSKIIVENLQEANVFVNPSFIESYSMVVAEAMSIGTPSVITFAGAMPELAVNNKEALFFSQGDYKQCAYQIIKILKDYELAVFLSKNAQHRSKQRILEYDVVKEQIDIYNKILNIDNKLLSIY